MLDTNYLFDEIAKGYVISWNETMDRKVRIDERHNPKPCTWDEIVNNQGRHRANLRYVRPNNSLLVFPNYALDWRNRVVKLYSDSVGRYFSRKRIHATYRGKARTRIYLYYNVTQYWYGTPVTSIYEACKLYANGIYHTTQKKGLAKYLIHDMHNMYMGEHTNNVERIVEDYIVEQHYESDDEDLSSDRYLSFLR